MRKPFVVLALLFVAPLLQANPSTEEVVANAREFLGGDAALKEISSISYEGEFETAEGDTGTIRIIFQKPLQQRVEIIRGDLGEVTALNDFDGWRKTYDVTDEKRWSMALLESDKIRELQANTWENLNFFNGIERRRGWIENEGLAEVDDRSAVKLVFHHPGDVEFTRFFDEETGRLLMTKTDEGSEIREAGEIRVNGILFPETITMSKDGETLNEIRFHEIKINEEFKNDLFDVPSLMP